MRRRTFLATTVTAATSVTVSGCSTITSLFSEDTKYRTSTNVLNIRHQPDSELRTVTIAAIVENTTDYDERMLVRVILDWEGEGYTSQHSTSLPVPANSTERVVFEVEGNTELVGHEADAQPVYSHP